MKKYLLTMLAAVATLIGMSAQQPQQMQMTPMPLKPEVKSGVLPNGLSYYVLHNAEPKERANFYIAQKVGSTLEEPSQLGLAHFLEHMAFNGTTHYPGKNMLNYLQSKGIRFGADINAYTAFDETVYNIDNVPTTDRPLMDSVLLVLRDWCDGILLEESEIDAERGVIQEEWRQRNDAGTRMYTTILPQIFQEYQYQQMPIGKMEVVMNFKPEALRSYYKKWYRPDQQGIVIVGDFDAAEMEKKVIELFSTVPMPENAAPRVYPEVSNNAEPIYVTYADKETQFPSITVNFKYDKTPFEYRNTVEAYMQDNIAETIISSMINERLSEAAQDPNSPFIYAGFGFSDFLVAKTKGAVRIYVVPKENLEDGFKAAVAIVAQACKAGFNDAELQRAKDAMIAEYEKLYNERNTTSTSSYARELIRHFVDNEPAPGVEAELELVKQVLPMLPVQAFNQMAADLLTPENEVIMVSIPDTGAFEMPTREQLVSDLQAAINATYETKLEEVITEPLIAKLPKKGSVKSQTHSDVYDAEVLTLSNGVKVIVKTTDFKSDEISMQAFREGGLRSYTEADAANVKVVSDAVNLSNLGTFDPVKLGKYLAGKQAGVGFSVANYTDLLSGGSTVKDLPTLMELIYATFTSLNPNPESFESMMHQYRAVLQNKRSNPEYAFSELISNVCYNNNPLMGQLNIDLLDKVDYNKSLDIAKKAMSNAADYTFIFSGNVDAATLKPYLEQYIASLPSKKKPSKVKTVTDLNRRTGDISEQKEMKAQVSSVFVFDVCGDNNVAYNTRNDILVSMIGDILDIIYVETLREEEGGTYGASVGAAMNPNTGYWALQYYFQTNHDQKAAMLARAQKELKQLLANGAKADHFNKVKEAMLKQYEIQCRTNGYWLNAILGAERGFNTFSDYQQTLSAITLEDLNGFMKNLYNGKNNIQVVLDAVEEGSK